MLETAPSQTLPKSIKGPVHWHGDYRHVSTGVIRMNLISHLLESHRAGHTCKYVLPVASMIGTSGDQIEGQLWGQAKDLFTACWVEDGAAEWQQAPLTFPGQRISWPRVYYKFWFSCILVNIFFFCCRLFSSELNIKNILQKETARPADCFFAKWVWWWANACIYINNQLTGPCWMWAFMFDGILIAAINNNIVLVG